MSDDEQIAELVDAISRYVDDHPQARDTLEGIAQWWVGPSLQLRLCNLQAAVELLEANGRLARTELDGLVIYSAYAKSREA